MKTVYYHKLQLSLYQNVQLNYFVPLRQCDNSIPQLCWQTFQSLCLQHAAEYFILAMRTPNISTY